MNEIESTFVKPFYLKMMGLNALRTADDLWADLIAASRTVTVREVRWMLRTGHWRPVVMGAWFSVAVTAEPVRDDLMAAMSQSRGSLTAPPLAAAATLVAGTAAVPAMTSYIEFMTASAFRDGSENVVAAAVEHLRGEVAIVPTDEGRRAFLGIHDVAIRLGDAVRATRPH
ncbi:DUF6000 family protein [Virgisporangium aurantiacum]|uniref:Uncharacterized protein n=1 Tax=Virgisporangium aurantiacum TaxID=175570 RepID=A0A8J4E7Z4_9ACTN|nr:DUF6000 family protein [Virgisporangium aurantiacum]GIJ62277.1 hypothetical protein Vau01_097930 [Virgisporangium aurantiacum]